MTVRVDVTIAAPDVRTDVTIEAPPAVGRAIAPAPEIVVGVGPGSALVATAFTVEPSRPDAGLGLDPRDPLMVGGEVVLALVVLIVGGRIVASRVFGSDEAPGGPN